jgi:hypothetical protein
VSIFDFARQDFIEEGIPVAFHFVRFLSLFLRRTAPNKALD